MRMDCCRGQARELASKQAASLPLVLKEAYRAGRQAQRKAERAGKWCAAPGRNAGCPMPPRLLAPSGFLSPPVARELVAKLEQIVARDLIY